VRVAASGGLRQGRGQVRERRADPDAAEEGCTEDSARDGSVTQRSSLMGGPPVRAARPFHATRDAQQRNKALSSTLMHAGHRDVAQIRLDNALALFDEFVHNTVKHPDAATLRGLERRFAERLQIQPSYWSQIKSRSRQIGERLARQFEQLCHKPYGWMDQPHGALTPSIAAAEVPAEPAGSPLPQDDDDPAVPDRDDPPTPFGLFLLPPESHAVHPF